MKRYFAALALLALAACATATPYQAATGPRQPGYAEQRIEDARYRITFSGNSMTERETVETYMLYRAAELTLEQNYDHFVVTTRDVDRSSRLLPSGAGPYAGFYPSYSWYHPRFGWRPFYDPFWDDTTYREVTQYQAVAEVMLRKGQKTPGDPQAFDARQVIENLKGKIVRPKSG